MNHYLLKRVFKQIVPQHCDFDMTWQGIGGTEVSELSKFPSETSLIL